ncbi:MAG: hypothetical protein CBC91_07565 [Rickettsiales bacterium TMED131]|nr:MAG: hypothetical protein CBC91_07565 [Rickettsiales bacterium TMED131]
MPTWPSGSKASTSNVDSPTDSITSARADIQQNISNVNDIIDTFNIASPSDGDLLQYSSSSGKWEQVATSSVGAQANIVAFDSTVNEDSTGTPSDYASTFTVTGGGSITTSTNTLTIPAGVFVLQTLGYIFQSTASTAPYNSDDIEIRLINNTGTVLATSVEKSVTAAGGKFFFGFNTHFTLASQTVCRIELDIDDSEGLLTSYQLPPMLFLKIS